MISFESVVFNVTFSSWHGRYANLNHQIKRDQNSTTYSTHSSCSVSRGIVCVRIGPDTQLDKCVQGFIIFLIILIHMFLSSVVWVKIPFVVLPLRPSTVPSLTIVPS